MIDTQWFILPFENEDFFIDVDPYKKIIFTPMPLFTSPPRVFRHPYIVIKKLNSPKLTNF